MLAAHLSITEPKARLHQEGKGGSASINAKECAPPSLAAPLADRHSPGLLSSFRGVWVNRHHLLQLCLQGNAQQTGSLTSIMVAVPGLQGMRWHCVSVLQNGCAAD
eukprot:1161705-Pelagomonas_calceolata.AAC.3